MNQLATDKRARVLACLVEGNSVRATVRMTEVSSRLQLQELLVGTRLTNAFSKKLENHEHAVALYLMNYNFPRIHQTLRVTPAMKAGIADRVWDINENRWSN